MGKRAPNTPPTPDPAATAAAQGAQNRETAIANQEMSMVDQLTPFGSLTYSPRGETEAGNPQYTATTALNPEQQAMLDTQNRVAQQYGDTAETQLANVSSTLAQPVDYSSLGDAPQANEATRTATRDAMLARLNPQMDRQRAALDTRLANQGFMVGTQGYDTAVDEMNRARNDQYLAADALAGNEMSRMYGLEASARDRVINELLQQRQVPLNELSAMMTGAQVQGPQFVNTPSTNMAPADIMGATYGSANLANQQWLAQQQAATASQQGLMGLLGTGAMAGGLAYGKSDRRLKEDIQPLGFTIRGLPVYTWRYKWGGPVAVGFMADEVRNLFPNAVRRFGEYDAVNYAEVLS